MNLAKDGLWVAWERHRRTETLVERMGIPLIILESRRGRLWKHPLFVLRTVAALIRVRPRILFVQNPSAFLTLLAIFLKPILRYRLVVDAHNAGVYPFEEAHEKFSGFFPFFHRRADLTIVTNDLLAQIVRKNGGRPLILPDALPNMETDTVVKSDRGSGDAFVVTFICTFASDEPYSEVFDAAAALSSEVVIQVTGNPEKMTTEEKESLASNVRLMGFLPEPEFVQALVNSDVIMDLTTFDDCLVCGAYEAVALGVPMVLSDTPALRGYFRKGAVFAENHAAGLAGAVQAARRDLDRLGGEIRELKQELEIDWQSRYQSMLQQLGVTADQPGP